MKITNTTRNAFLISCALLGAAIAALAIRASRNEATFFQDARDRRWPVTPVVVSYSADVAKAWEAQVQDAVRRINDEAGCTVLSTSGERPDIRIITPLDDSPCANAGRAANPDEPNASTHVCLSGTTDIVLDKGAGHIREAYLIIKHELLHALGLDHDPSGILAPRLPDWSWERIDVPGEMLSSADRLALADRYCTEVPDAR